MLYNELTKYQKTELQRLSATYANSGMFSTEGNHELLLRLNNPEEEEDLIDIIKEEINFYNDVTTLLVGEIVKILLTDTTTEPII